MKKWIMKQYWRVGTIRAISSLALGMLVLGRLYYIYIPGFSDKGLLGALTLGIVLFFIFMGLGWVYDVKARIWSQKAQAGTERSVYSYVPDYRALAIDYAVFYALLHTMRNILRKAEIDTEFIDDSLKYLMSYFNLSTTRRNIFAALPAAIKYNEVHPIKASPTQTKHKAGFIARMKLSFQIHMLRLTWIQSLTGLLQDVLIFGTIYATTFYYGGVEVIGEIIPFEYLVQGVLFLSLPLFILLATLGWFYDKRFQIWSPDLIVKVERNPYTYIAEPKIHIMVVPIFYVFLKILRDVIIAAGIGDKEINRSLNYIRAYCELDVSRNEDISKAMDHRASYGELFKHSGKRG